MKQIDFPVCCSRGRCAKQCSATLASLALHGSSFSKPRAIKAFLQCWLLEGFEARRAGRSAALLRQGVPCCGQVLAAGQMLALEDQPRKHRLMHLRDLVTRGPPELWRILQVEAELSLHAWLGLARADMHWLQKSAARQADKAARAAHLGASATLHSAWSNKLVPFPYASTA